MMVLTQRLIKNRHFFVAVAAASLAALSIYSSLLNWHLGCLNLSSHFLDGRQSQKSAAEENR